MPRKTTKTKETEWFVKPWTKLVATLTGAAFLIGIGYSGGSFKNGIECDLEKMSIRQELTDKLTKEINACQNDKLRKYEQESNSLKEVLEYFIKNKNNEKK